MHAACNWLSALHCIHCNDGRLHWSVKTGNWPSTNLDGRKIGQLCCLVENICTGSTTIAVTSCCTDHNMLHTRPADEVASATGRREQLFVLAPASGGVGGYPTGGQAGYSSSLDYLTDIMGGLSMVVAPAGAAHEVNGVAAVHPITVMERPVGP
jgi:hypothetical protein